MNDILPLFVDEALEGLRVWEKEAEILDQIATPEAIRKVSLALESMKGAATGLRLHSFSTFVGEILEFFVFLQGQGVSSFYRSAPLLSQCRKQLVEWLEKLRKQPEFEPDLSSIWDKMLEVNPAAQIEKSRFSPPKNLGQILIESKVATA